MEIQQRVPFPLSSSYKIFRTAFSNIYNFCLKHVILRRNQRDIIINVHRCSCKVPVMFLTF